MLRLTALACAIVAVAGHGTYYSLPPLSPREEASAIADQI